MNYLTLSHHYDEKNKEWGFWGGLKKTITALLSLFTNSWKNNNEKNESNNKTLKIKEDLELYKEIFLLQEESCKDWNKSEITILPELIKLRLKAAGLCIHLAEWDTLDEDIDARKKFIEVAIDHKDDQLAVKAQQRLDDRAILQELEKELQAKYHILYKWERFDIWVIYFWSGTDKSAAMVVTKNWVNTTISLHKGIETIIAGNSEFSLQQND